MADLRGLKMEQNELWFCRGRQESVVTCDFREQGEWLDKDEWHTWVEDNIQREREREIVCVCVQLIMMDIITK